jgi:hypothetical protein
VRPANAKPIDWNELNSRLRPNFLGHVAHIQESLSYSRIRQAYAHTILQASEFAGAILDCDPKQRYSAWVLEPQAAYQCLGQNRITGYADLFNRIASHEGVEVLLTGTGIPLPQFTGFVYFIRYWCIPTEVPVRELLEPGNEESKAWVRQLKEAGIASNLAVLETGRAATDRLALAEKLAIPLTFITDLVHRADLRRLPYHSQKTISYLIHAGAGNMAVLAEIDPQCLRAQVLSYGETTGKDLKYGVEPISSALIARTLPLIVG